jgi:hypothetical protein
VAIEEPNKVVRIVTVSKLADLVEAMDGVRRQTRAHAVYQSILKNILGEEWFNRHVMTMLLDPKKTPGYLGYKVYGDNWIDEPSVQRIHHLAEMMLNMQLVPGFHDRVEQIKTLSPENMEGAYAELEAASVLFWHGLNFRFVEKKKGAKRGTDYDLEVARNGRVIAIDAKCKIESTEVNLRSLENSLRDTIDQLPEDGPGAIIVKVPSHWFSDEQTIPQDMVDLTLKFFRETGRIMSVVYYTPFRDFEGGQVRVNHRWSEIRNVGCRYQHIAKSLLEGFEPMKEWETGQPRWIDLGKIISGRPKV